MAQRFYTYLSSEDSEDIFTSNTASSFRCLLPEEVNLSDGPWYCALIELTLPREPTQALYLTTDFVESSIAGPRKLPIISGITQTVTRPRHLSFFRVKTTSLSTVELNLVNRLGQPVTLPSRTTRCTLVFCNHEAVSH